MADEPKPGPGLDDRPPFFKTVNGWIAGLTGLVLAFAGLFTACDKLFPDEPKTVASTSNNTEAPAVTPLKTEKTDASAPSQYTGQNGVTMDWDFDETQWVLTDNDVKYYYEEVVSPDDTQVLGYDKTNQAYLRWPIKGGMAEESKNDKASWVPYLKLYPVVEPGAPAN